MAFRSSCPFVTVPEGIWRKLNEMMGSWRKVTNHGSSVATALLQLWTPKWNFLMLCSPRQVWINSKWCTDKRMRCWRTREVSTCGRWICWCTVGALLVPLVIPTLHALFCLGLKLHVWYFHLEFTLGDSSVSKTGSGTTMHREDFTCTSLLPHGGTGASMYWSCLGEERLHRNTCEAWDDWEWSNKVLASTCRKRFNECLLALYCLVWKPGFGVFSFIVNGEKMCHVTALFVTTAGLWTEEEANIVFGLCASWNSAWHFFAVDAAPLGVLMH